MNDSEPGVFDASIFGAASGNPAPLPQPSAYANVSASGPGETQRLNAYELLPFVVFTAHSTSVTVPVGAAPERMTVSS